MSGIGTNYLGEVYKNLLICASNAASYDGNIDSERRIYNGAGKLTPLYVDSANVGVSGKLRLGPIANTTEYIQRSGAGKLLIEADTKILMGAPVSAAMIITDSASAITLVVSEGTFVKCVVSNASIKKVSADALSSTLIKGTTISATTIRGRVDYSAFGTKSANFDTVLIKMASADAASKVELAGDKSSGLRITHVNSNLYFTNGVLTPGVTDTHSLGTALKRFANLYVASATADLGQFGTLNITEGGDVELDSIDCVSATIGKLDGVSRLSFKNAGAICTVEGVSAIVINKNDVTVKGGNLIMAASKSILPASDKKTSLGTTDKRYLMGYIVTLVADDTVSAMAIVTRNINVSGVPTSSADLAAGDVYYRTTDYILRVKS